MQKLRIFLVLLIIGISFFFNIERIDIDESNVINIASFVYVLAFFAIILPIAFPPLQQLKLPTMMIIWSGIYVWTKLIFSQRPLIGGMYTYVSITELAMLLVLIWTTSKLLEAIQLFENAVEKITFGQPEELHVKMLATAGNDIRQEMFRSRHYNRPLSIIAVQPNLDSTNPNTHQIIQETQKAMINSFIINNIANTLQKYLRPTDLILEDKHTNRFYILCPETPSKDVQSMIEYIQDVTNDELGIASAVGFAVFPEDAIAFEDLLNKSVARLSEQISSSTHKENL